MRRSGLLTSACLLGLVLVSGSAGGGHGATASTGELAFVRGKLFVSGHIWSAKWPTGELRQLTRGRLESEPVWPPDGRRLAFTGYSRTKPGAGARSDIYILDLATGLRRRVTNNAHLDGSPSWSPDGKRLVYSANNPRGGGRDLMIVAAAGGQPRRLLATARFEGNPHWAPKGERVLFSSAIGDLYLIRSDGTGERRILRNVETANWSPDGASIVFTRKGIYVARSDGTNVRLLSTLYATDPAWSPDGRMLAFNGDAREHCGAVEYKPVIVLLPVRPPGPPAARACTEADEFDPEWRPTP